MFLLKLLKLITVTLLWLLSPIYLILYLRSSKQLPPIENQLLTVSAGVLGRKIRKRQVSCEDVITAYINRIQQVNPIINAVTSTQFSLAIDEAKQVDKFLNETTLTEDKIYQLKPLLGLPLTVKESCKVKGFSFAVGSRTRLGFVAGDDGVCVGKLRRAGAIVLAVTNMPEFSFGIECNNLLTGTTCNPYNTNFTSGGSSGGEGALLASAASLLGLGTDLGGSIRIPCMFNGIFGHKPSTGIVSTEGLYPTLDDDNFFRYICMGPMVRYASDLRLMMKVISDRGQNFDEKVSLDKVTVFFMESMDNNLLSPKVDKEIKLILLSCVRHLEENCGSTVSDVKFDFSRSFENTTSCFHEFRNVPDIFVDQNDPKKRYNFFAECLKTLIGSSTLHVNLLCFHMIMNTHRYLVNKDYDECIREIGHLKKTLNDELGQYGVLLYPTFHTSAFMHRNSVLHGFGMAYTMIFNVLGFPATHVPLGLNKKGLPIGIQVIAKPYRDALCFTVAEELEKCFGGWRKPRNNE